jgi:hypothetical protein
VATAASALTAAWAAPGPAGDDASTFTVAASASAAAVTGVAFAVAPVGALVLSMSRPGTGCASLAGFALVVPVLFEEPFAVVLASPVASSLDACADPVVDDVDDADEVDGVDALASARSFVAPWLRSVVARSLFVSLARSERGPVAEGSVWCDAPRSACRTSVSWGAARSACTT